MNTAAARGRDLAVGRTASVRQNKSPFIWLVLFGGTCVAVLAGVGAWTALRGRVGLGSGARDLGARLGKIEARIQRLEMRASAPRFVLDPSQPADPTSLAAAVADLSSGLADLRSEVDQLGSGSGSGSADPLARALMEAGSPDAGKRRRAIDELKRLARSDAHAFDMLKGMLRDGDTRVRREALNALEDLQDPSVLPEVKSLLADPDRRVRGKAATTLADLADDSKDPALRSAAVRDLQALLTDGDAEVRKDVAEGLRDIGGAEAMPGLLAAVKDSDFEVRAEAIEGLRDSGDPAAAAALREAYGNGSGAGALDAAVALRRFGDDSAFQKETPRLAALAQQSGDPDERRSALRVLAENAPQTAAPLLQKALNDPSDRVRREAERALQRMKR